MDNNLNNSNFDSPMLPPQTEQKEAIKPASTVDFVFAILALLSGFLFIKNSLTSALGIGMTAFVLFFVTISLLYAKRKNVKLGFSAFFGAGIIILFSAVFVLSDNMFLKGWTLVFECIAIIYWYYCMFHCREKNKIDDMFLFDIFKAVFVMPFGSFSKVIWAISTGIKEKRGAKRIGYILLGLVIAFVPSMLVLSLLLNADGAFSNLMSLLFADIGDIFGMNIVPLFLGIPVAMYLFGLMFSCSEKRSGDVSSREKNEKMLQSCRFVSNVIICSALTPLLLIYLLFFISQSAYFLSAFHSIVPEGMNNSQYAREGFFQLCTVSGINAVIISVTAILGKRKEDNSVSCVQRVYTVLFSVFTIALVITAVRKLVLYIDNYGLTLKRVYAAWFLLLIGALFILLLVKQFRTKLNYMRSAVVVFVLLFGTLVFCDVDARIAEYNVNHYISKELNTLDVEILDQLSESAVPYLIEGYDQFEEDIQKNIDNKLMEYADKYNNDSFLYSYRSFNIPSAKAIELLEDNGYEVPRIFSWEW